MTPHQYTTASMMQGRTVCSTVCSRHPGPSTCTTAAVSNACAERVVLAAYVFRLLDTASSFHNQAHVQPVHRAITACVLPVLTFCQQPSCLSAIGPSQTSHQGPARSRRTYQQAVAAPRSRHSPPSPPLTAPLWGSCPQAAAAV